MDRLKKLKEASKEEGNAGEKTEEASKKKGNAGEKTGKEDGAAQPGPPAKKPRR